MVVLKVKLLDADHSVIAAGLAPASSPERVAALFSLLEAKGVDLSLVRKKGDSWF